MSQIFKFSFFFPSNWFGGDGDKDESNGIIEEIRSYYGEAIAFYFLFTVFYIKALLPMILVGIIWFVVQMCLDEIAVKGSIIGVLVAIIWTTVMLEYWYRLEWKWIFKWGQINYAQHDMPQANFKGKHSSIRRHHYWLKS